jgi:hypothetical protein
MNKLFLSFVAAIAAVQSFGQLASKTVQTKISDVTVFLSGAQITESATVQLKEGEKSI